MTTWPSTRRTRSESTASSCTSSANPGRWRRSSSIAAGAFSSTAAMARLLGETEFTMLFHQGVKESIHVAAVDEHAILLAIFDSRTTVGMVRLFAKEAGTAIGASLAETRTRPQRTGS